VKPTKKPAIAPESDRTVDIYIKAAEIFHEQGFDATSMSNIAEAVDLTKAGLYYYIESKEELLFAIINMAMEWLETKVIEPSRQFADPEQRLKSVIACHGRILTEGNKAITILTDEIEALTPKHRRLILDRKRLYFDFVRDTLEALRAAGRLRDVNSTVATFGLFGTLLWLPRWYRPDGQLSPSEIIEEVTNIVIGGLLKQDCA
jgi:TetR/AcrR family transcriptional regulator, cholesterol catabolism regulator